MRGGWRTQEELEGKWRNRNDVNIVLICRISKRKTKAQCYRQRKCIAERCNILCSLQPFHLILIEILNGISHFLVIKWRPKVEESAYGDSDESERWLCICFI